MIDRHFFFFNSRLADITLPSTVDEKEFISFLNSGLRYLCKQGLGLGHITLDPEKGSVLFHQVQFFIFLFSKENQRC